MRDYAIVFALLTAVVSAGNVFGQTPTELVSPDGKIVFAFSLGEDKSPQFDIKFNGKPVILKSQMGVSRFEKGFSIAKSETDVCDQTWRPIYGERALVRDNYRSLKLYLTRSGLPMNVEVRAYNAGIAFRYQFPERGAAGGNDLTIDSDLTQYSFPDGTMAWHTRFAQDVYELLPLSGWKDEAERPLVLRLPDGVHAALGEAQVVDYVRTKYILQSEKKNTIACKMYQAVDLTTPFYTPWHVVMIAEKSRDLLANNDIFLNLNPPCALEDTSWIAPGKVMREVTLSTEGGKALVDFAVKHNIQYIHLDAGWYGYEYAMASDATTVTVDPRRNPRGDLNLPEVIQYAKEKNVGVLLYVNQRALHNQLDELLPLYKKWGVKGIKFGFVRVGSFYWTKWMHDAIKKCAQYQLMADVHDEYRPTGFSRTYPNFMTQEGILGNEAMPSATHNTHLPFTRFLCGPADYTICYYTNKISPEQKKANPKARGLQTTSAHQLALSVIYYSPFQFVYWYDKPASANDEPELEWFDNISTVWDDTAVIDGEIGEFAVIGRKKSDSWFVGAITNDSERDIEIPLSFLDSGKTYMAKTYFDDSTVQTRTQVGIKTQAVTRDSVLKVHLRPTGGEAIWITPQNVQ